MKTFFETIKRNDLKYGGFMTFYIIAACVVSVAGIFITKLTGDLSQAALEFDADVIIRFLAVMAAITGIKAIASALTVIITQRFSAKAGYKLRENFAKHFAFLPFSEFEKKNSGEMLSLYSSDMPQAVVFITSGSLNMISDIVSGIIAFIYMATINPVFTLLYFITFPLLVLLQVKISAPLHKKVVTMSTERAKFNAVVNDSLQNTSTVIAYSLEEAMEERYLSCYDKFYRAHLDYLKSLLPLVMSGIVATMIPLLFINVAAGLSVAANKMSISEFIAFTAVAGIAGGWLTMLSQRLRSIRSAAASADRINSNTAEQLEDVSAQADSATFTADDTAVRFENVSFSYTDGVPVLDKVSFEIKSGEKIAIVGASGSGKSTVLKLMLSLYQPDGNIYISGANIAGVSKKALRNHLAYVPQDSYLFPVSIRENIALVCREGEAPNEEKLVTACKAADIWDFIKNLPQGFDTILSESAENISGGQRQRIAIARAFLQDAPIVLFDEATSSLDSVTEDDILKTFGALMKGRTAVMVAHRIKAIMACDRIIFLDKGKVAGIGRHEDLLAENAAYTALYESLRTDSSADSSVDESQDKSEGGVLK